MMKSLAKQIIVLACALSLTPAATPAPATAPQAFRATVISVTDGDTLIVARDGVPTKVRLVDVDCPEKGQPFGRAAKKYLNDMVYLREVTVDTAGKDRYGRTLASIKLPDGRRVNDELLRSGYAWVYRGKLRDKTMKQLEMNARTAKRGLWSEPNAIAPWTFRKSQREMASRKYPANVSDRAGLVKQLLNERTK
jgi:endonuclease YncB( thermonuclease family)